MRKNRTTGCLLSCGIALALFCSFWLAMRVQASPPGQGASYPVPASFSAPTVSPRQGTTATVYLPVVMGNYPVCELPPLNWASAAGGILLRWRWPDKCEPPATFRVYRTDPGGTPALINDSVAPVTDPAQAEAILGDDWPAIQSDLGISTTDQLHAIRTENPLQAAYLANRHYRVALVYGWGYSDTAVAGGTIYTYAVDAVRQRDGSAVAIGQVVAQAGSVTPLARPTGLTATQVISEPLVGAVDWVKAQKNRKADRRIYLRWDVDQADPTTATLDAAAAGLTPPWLVGYDVYRSESPTGPFTLLNDEPILPMTTTRPASDPISVPYELHDYFFHDADPTIEYSRTYYYRVAPRDLLGRPLDWANDEHKPQLSGPVAAVPRDMMPPQVPLNLTATPRHLDYEVVLTWTAQTTDTVGYRLYWSWHPTASVLSPACADPETCWRLLADVPTTATSVYTHVGIMGPLQRDKPYWYRIRAVDAAGNLSAPSEPVHASLHDRFPPGTPDIVYDGEVVRIQKSPGDTDVVEALLYCSVDDGPFRLWKVLEPDAVGEAVYDLYHQYKPPVPTRLVCQAQVVDANGNRSGFSALTSVIEITPPVIKDPPAPIITVISTTGSVEKGWEAVVNWEAEPTPGVKGFRLYRQVYPSGPVVTLTTESSLGRETRAFTDTTVEPDKVYSYTVAIYRPPGFYGGELVKRSQPYLYEVVPPLGERSRQIVEIAWQDHTFTPGTGTYLRWTIDDECHRSILFRSMEKDRGYVQLTPPRDITLYTDADAEHPDYWYVALWLDCTSGEVIGRTEPWSAGATVARAQPDPGNGAAPSPVSASWPAALLRPAMGTLPAELYLGWETEAPPFTIGQISYTVNSTLTKLSGSGVMTMGGGGLAPFTRTVVFSDLGADASGHVSTGTVPLDVEQEITYPDGLAYKIGSLDLDRHSGNGHVTLVLTAHIQLVENGNAPTKDVELISATIHPDATFDQARTGLSADPCSVTTPTLYFEMNPLPMRIVPINTVTYTSAGIFFGNGTCTQYEERYTGPRPGYPDPDASDRLLRDEYGARGGQVWIGGDGLEGKMTATLSLSYKWTVAVPYGLRLQGTEAWLQFKDNQIVDGRIAAGSTSLLYYTLPPNYYGFDWVDPPDRSFDGLFDTLYVGQGGSLYGTVQRSATGDPVEWAGYRLDDITYTLYVPPIETSRMPWEEAIGEAEPREEIEARLSLTLPGSGLQSGVNKTGDADFTWLNCGREVTFTDGVVADAYLRRGGMSDYFTATIPPGSEVEASIYGYAVYLTRFRLAFFDNENYDKDIAGDLSLPDPANIKLPLIDFHIDTAGCVESARIRPGAEPVLGHWQIQTHPKAVEFRPDVSAKFPDGMALWVLGRIEIPHLALPTGDGSPPDYESGLPLDMSLTPAGEFHAFEWKEESGRYLFDGFDFLIEGIGLSEVGQQPGWDPAATLGDPPCTPPACGQGFITATGHLLTPLYGELVEEGGTRPELQFLAEGDFVGFRPRPQVERGWTDKVGFGFRFDLVYAHDAGAHAGRFVAWDQETFVESIDFLQVFTLDWATAISPTQTGIYFGLSTVPALVRSLAETAMETVPVTFTEQLSQTAWQEWFPALGIIDALSTEEARGYLNFSKKMWISVTNPAQTTAEIDKLKDEAIPTTPKGGATIGELADWGVHFDKVRGQAAFVPVESGGEVVDYYLEELRVSLRMNITWPGGGRALDTDGGVTPSRVIPAWYRPAAGTADDEGDSFIKAKRITFQITRDGDYAIVGKGVRANLAEYLNKTVDFALLLNISDRPRLEGGLIIYELNFEAVKFERIGGVFGMGDAFFYLGGLGDAKYQGNNVGGAFLFGTIYADSIVLREMGFADLLDRLGDTGGGDVLVGGYLRVYGDFSIYNVGCLFRVNVGGEVAAWYFAALHGNDNAWGGRLRGYVFGKLLCVVSARGDLTLEIFHPGHPEGDDSFAFRGQFWVAGGIGFCEPDKWKSWETRWWKDKWCWTCGAIIWADYNYTKPDAWKWDYDGDCE